MNARQWDEHKRRLCAICRHDRGRRHCPLVAAMDRDPEDPVAGRCFQRLGSCSQFEVPPPKEKGKGKKKATRRAGK